MKEEVKIGCVLVAFALLWACVGGATVLWFQDVDWKSVMRIFWGNG